VFLREAVSVGDPDLAAFFAEQAIQLYIKAVYYKLFGDLIRGHKLRELVSILAISGIFFKPSASVNPMETLHSTSELSKNALIDLYITTTLTNNYRVKL
jgi:HEPN domain-containing protein